MRRLWEVTPGEVRVEADQMRERLRAADCEAAPLLKQQLAELDKEEGDEPTSPDDVP
jgi:hypothetical protein